MFYCFNNMQSFCFDNLFVFTHLDRYFLTYITFHCHFQCLCRIFCYLWYWCYWCCCRWSIFAALDDFTLALSFIVFNIGVVVVGELLLELTVPSLLPLLLLWLFFCYCYSCHCYSRCRFIFVGVEVGFEFCVPLDITVVMVAFIIFVIFSLF